MEYRPDDPQWQPRARDLCAHCGCDWHGLPCLTYRCGCLGTFVLGQAPEEKD